MEPILRKLAPGERVSAADYNALVEALQRQRMSGAAAPLEWHRSALGTFVSPATGPKFELLELTEPLEAHAVDKAAKRLMFRLDDVGEEADPSDRWIDSGVSARSVADAQAGAYLPGERRLCFFHPAAGRFVPVDTYQWHLGVLDEGLVSGGSATVSLWQLFDAGLSDSNVDVTAYDWFLDAGQQLPGGTRVIVQLLVHSRKWIVTQAGNCPVDAEA
ncbi:MAG: hypothetical protein QM775_35140 [Pirellulales bacterium]